MPEGSDVRIVAGYRPGAIGAVTALHGRYYAQSWGLERRFEAEVARELGEFTDRFDAGRDGFWLALDGDNVAGAIVMDGGDGQRPGLRLRWFILDPAYHGLGIGRRLMQAAMDFAAARGASEVYLMTFEGLDTARRIYEAWGFRLVETRRDTDWNRAGVTHQTFARAP